MADSPFKGWMTLLQIGLSSNFWMHLRVNRCLSYFHILAIVKAEFSGDYRFLYNVDIAFSLDVYLKTGLLGAMVVQL